MSNFTAMSKATAKNAFSSQNLGSTLSSAAGGIGGIIGTAVDLSQIADTSDIRNQAEAQAHYIPKAQSNEDLLSEWSNRGAFNFTNYNQVRGKSEGEIAGGVFSAIGQGASTGAQMGGGWGALAGAIIGGASAIGGAVAGNKKAKQEVKELNSLIAQAEQQNLNNFVNKASSIDKSNDFLALYNSAANGGLLNIMKHRKNLFDDGGFTNSKIKQKAIDYDMTLPVRLINYAENPDSIGWNANTRTWHQVFQKGLDEKNLGMGVDIDYVEDNPKEAKLIKIDKTGNKYLTEEDERYLRHKKIKEAEESYKQRLNWAQKFTKSNKTPSETKKAVTMSAIYNLGAGKVANVLFEDPELMNALMNGTDEEYINIVHQYYDNNSNKVIKPRAERIRQERKFFNMKSIGGPLNSLFNNGVTKINNGDTHENNPNEGIQIGVDKQGIPNLVEEGEVIWNDYVFSNRIKIPKNIQNKYKLKEMTFADAVKKLQKESEERPNDPISKNGLEASLIPLITAQETIRQKKEMNKIKREFANGGKLSNLFNGGGELDTSFLRYAPAIGSAIGATQSLLSKPDYSNANKIENAALQALNYKEAAYKPLGDYMEYKPFDRNYYINQLQAESNALRRAISNQGSLSANAALLAADYNAQTKLGELFRQAEEYNATQKQKVKEFNRGTKSLNADMLMKASLANQAAANNAKSVYLQGILESAKMREALALANATSDSQALSNLFTNLGNIGTDSANKKSLQMLIDSGALMSPKTQE